METCHVCNKGNLVRTASKFGPEIYCDGCRRVILSSYLGFNFTAARAADEIEECKVETPQGPMPGWKGPGKKAKCHIFEPGDSEGEQAAKSRAIDSAYAHEHNKIASRIVNSTAGFMGAPTSLMPPQPPTSPMAAPDLKGSTNVKPQPTSSQDFSNTGQTGIGEATAPGGMQPGNMNSNTPVNSGTTARKKIAELLEDTLGKKFCTQHMVYDGCNPDENSQ
jgi:hypothetical protein